MNRLVFIFLLLLFVRGYALDTEMIEERIFQLVNHVRLEYGLENYDYLDDLETPARVHVNNMMYYDFFDHSDQLGRAIGERIEEYCPGLFGAFGENLARMSAESDEEAAEEIVSAWLSSDSHRDSLLSRDYDSVAVAVGEGDGMIIAALVFADIAVEINDIGLRAGTDNSLRISAVRPELNDNLSAYVEFPDSSLVTTDRSGASFVGYGHYYPDFYGDEMDIVIDLLAGKGEYVIRIAESDVMLTGVYTFCVE